MLEQHLRQIATVLLETAIRIAPQDTRDWGQGMLSELAFVEGRWEILMWALGSASVIARSALVSALIPGRRERNLIPDGGLFAKSFPLREVTLAVCGVFVAGTMLFFLGPPFRQGVRVSLEAWRDVLLVTAPKGPASDSPTPSKPLGAKVFGREVAARNALVLHVAALALFIFLAMAVFAGAALGLGALKNARRDPRRPQSVAWVDSWPVPQAL